jgi:hypothetical protein
VSEQQGDLGIAGSDLLIANSTSGNVFRVPLAGGPTTAIAGGQFHPAEPIGCGADVCWLVTGLAPPPGPILGFDANGMPVMAPLGFDCGPLASECVVGGIVRMRMGAPPETLFLSRDLQWLGQFAFDGSDFLLSLGADISPGWTFRVNGAGGSAVGIDPSGYGFAVDDDCFYAATIDGVFSVAKSALPATTATARSSPNVCTMGDAGTVGCDIALECSTPRSGTIGCSVCEAPDGQAVDCRDAGNAIPCGTLACGVGCTCEDANAGACVCGAR